MAEIASVDAPSSLAEAPKSHSSLTKYSSSAEKLDEGTKNLDARVEPSSGWAVHRTTKISRLNRLLKESWIGEIVAWCFAAASVISIVIILFIYKDKPLTRWHALITLNTLINFISQLAQTFLLIPVVSAISQLKWLWFRKVKSLGDIDDFDEASRQPFYGLVLIWKHPEWSLLYLATINGILIVFIGPFTQQSVTLEPRQVSTKEGPFAASIPIVTEYNSSHFTDVVRQVNQNGNVWNFEFDTVPPEMKDAIMQGLSEEEADHSAVEASYTISNCSFTPYSSLGVCHSIEDWTQHILKQCGTNNTRHSKCSSSVLEIQQHPAFRLENSNVSASGMTILMSAFQYNTSLLELSQETQTSHYPDHRAHAYTDVFEFPANDVLGEFYVFYPSSEPRNQGNVFQYAFKGTLSLCVYTFNTTIVNGQTKTKVLDITRNLPWQVESQVVESEGNVRHDVYATYSDEFQRMKVGMDGKSRQSITNYLAREVFYGSWDGGLQTDSTMSTHKDHPRASSDAFRAIESALYGVDQMKIWEGLEKVEKLLGRVAIQMTNALRTTSMNPSQVSRGTTTKTEIYIAVNFYWLSLPVASVVLAFALLLAVIMSSRRHGIPAWKSSNQQLTSMLEPITSEAVGLDNELGSKINLKLIKRADGTWKLRTPNDSVNAQEAPSSERIRQFSFSDVPGSHSISLEAPH